MGLTNIKDLTHEMENILGKIRSREMIPNPEIINIILDMIRRLPGQGVTVVLIENNMDAIMRVCDNLIFMDQGKKIAEGNPEMVRNNPAVIEAYLE